MPHLSAVVFRKRRFAGLSRCGVAAAALILSACGQDNQYVPPPAPRVTVAAPVRQTVMRYFEATGTASAVNSADLVARVAGFVQEVNYRDGAEVAKGTVLFTIEPESYRVKFEQAQAAETGADATLKQAQTAFERQADLLTRQTTTQAAYDQALAARDSAKATLDQARANTRLARINVDYTRVTAPFDGIVTARQASVGEYVGGTGTPTVLATIVQFAPIHVNFAVGEQDVLHIRAAVARLGLKPDDLRRIPVEIGLQSESGYPHQGMLDYAAPGVDASTGTLAARAIFANTDRVLLPGYYVRVRIPRPQESREQLLVPDMALGSDQGGRYLLIVGKDDVVEQRKVEIGPVVGALRVIESGLGPEDRVIVSGLMRAVPGQKVDAQTRAPAGGASASGLTP